ncbi:MAG: hypothetical protein HOM34_07140 [Planctomycetes bacterium]|jgi:hypothetical protein|nr:hypothetical protein [Planctomycetota bacterium]MBT4029774.1 hypothetical protein [Planctomycetota bacterium]MBT4559835.1 hypothetical protein [Planctomycetota bacterium]MBT5120478.1 hypothetical protein [Planctomycetota bacterium]MBT7012101.1 hypothetical protein [Planctomycetota bacterium]
MVNTSTFGLSSRPLSALVGGCYVQEIAHDLGFLLLQSSVLNGLKSVDDFRYLPEESLVPSNPGLHNEKLIDVVSECRELVRLAVFSASSRFESIIIDEPERLVEMPAISLARMAQSFRPTCLQTAFAVASNEIREGHYRLAEATLLRASEFLVTPSDKSRWYQNRAANFFRRGDVAHSIQFAYHATQANPSSLLAQESYKAYQSHFSRQSQFPKVDISIPFEAKHETS